MHINPRERRAQSAPVVQRYKHHPTPKKAKVQGAHEFIEAKGLQYPNGLPVFKQHTFDFFHVNKDSGWNAIHPDSISRRHRNDPDTPKRRGRKSILSENDIYHIKQMLEEHGFWARAMDWKELATACFGEDYCSGRTLQRGMGTMEYHKCIACRKGWVNKELATERKAQSEAWLQLRPTKEDWRPVRCSDEIHFGRGPQNKPQIIRKPGQRYCRDCIQRINEPPSDLDKLKKRYHSWGTAGFDFKLPWLRMYETGQKNGKMNLTTYVDILETEVKPWLRPAYSPNNWILEEDRDSAHGLASKNDNIVVKWKKQHGLFNRCYFNMASSPDLAPIENIWKPVKGYVKKYPHFQQDKTVDLIQEGWQRVDQNWINYLCDSMPDRPKDCIEAERQMTGW